MLTKEEIIEAFIKLRSETQNLYLIPEYFVKETACKKGICPLSAVMLARGVEVTEDLNEMEFSKAVDLVAKRLELPSEFVKGILDGVDDCFFVTNKPIDTIRYQGAVLGQQVRLWAEDHGYFLNDIYEESY